MSAEVKTNPSYDLAVKTPPQALDLEEAVLGALLLEKDAIPEVIDLLKPATFYHPAHQDIYQAILTLFSANQPIDMRTVINQLRKDERLEKVGGVAYLIRLTNGVASAAHIVTYAYLLVEYAIRRNLITIASAIQTDAYDNTIETFSLLNQALQSLFEVSETNIKKSYTPIQQLIPQALRELEARRNRKDGLVGIPTGFSSLDSMICGLQKGDLITVAARPGMGKTSFLLSIAANTAIRHHHPVAFFSLEMSSMQVINRLLSAEVGLESEKIKKAHLKDYEWQQLYHRATKLAQAPIYLDDTPAISLFEFRAKARRLKAKHKVELIVIDYLQLMTADLRRRNGGNREQEIAAISGGLKAIAKELDVPIIVASQLSRAVETRGGDKRPQLSDLRESGAIEQDVDIAMFLYRPEYYGFTQDDQGHATQGLAEIIVAKHRNGPTGKVHLGYSAPTTKFHEFSGFGLS